MRGWLNRILLGVIGILTVLSVVTVWPSEPDRYLPGFIPWPEGKGIKFPWLRVEGGAILGYLKEARAMRLGLDLRGGTRLVMEADTSQAPDIDVDEALEGASRIIERRVNAFGVAESEIQRQGNNRLAVQLPDIDPEDARDLVGRTAVLEFREQKRDENENIFVCQGGTVTYNPPGCEGGQEVPVSPQSLTPQTAENVIWAPARATGGDGVEKELTGRFLKPNTYVSSHQITGVPILNFEMTGEGSRLLEQVTGRLVGLPMAFFLDGEPIRGEDGSIIAPIVRDVITDQGIIDGLEFEDARLLSIQLNAGAFPVPLQVVQQEEVDATLGDDSVKASVIAGEVAILVVMLFMVLYYRLPGVLASLALFVYASLVLAVFKVWPVTLTLAGIAAFILSVGMAVDANILIFERMKEELRLGRSLVASIDAGFSRAWSSIRDSNVSTLITCAILFWFGDQFGAALVKGFALTLGIGVLVSMFSAIMVTRTFLRLTIGTPLARRLGWWVADPAAVRGVAAATPAAPPGAGPPLSPEADSPWAKAERMPGQSAFSGEE
jgi:preprotein translocase subunit SecD